MNSVDLASTSVEISPVCVARVREMDSLGLGYTQDILVPQVRYTQDSL